MLGWQACNCSEQDACKGQDASAPHAIQFSRFRCNVTVAICVAAAACSCTFNCFDHASTCSVCPSTPSEAKSFVPGTIPIWPDTYKVFPALMACTFAQQSEPSTCLEAGYKGLVHAISKNRVYAFLRRQQSPQPRPYAVPNHAAIPGQGLSSRSGECQHRSEHATLFHAGGALLKCATQHERGAKDCGRLLCILRHAVKT